METMKTMERLTQKCGNDIIVTSDHTVFKFKLDFHSRISLADRH